MKECTLCAHAHIVVPEQNIWLHTQVTAEQRKESNTYIFLPGRGKKPYMGYRNTSDEENTDQRGTEL